jgi:hypothetical protein
MWREMRQFPAGSMAREHVSNRFETVCQAIVEKIAG